MSASRLKSGPASIGCRGIRDTDTGERRRKFPEGTGHELRNTRSKWRASECRWLSTRCFVYGTRYSVRFPHRGRLMFHGRSWTLRSMVDTPANIQPGSPVACPASSISHPAICNLDSSPPFCLICRFPKCSVSRPSPATTALKSCAGPPARRSGGMRASRISTAPTLAKVQADDVRRTGRGDRRRHQRAGLLSQPADARSGRSRNVHHAHPQRHRRGRDARPAGHHAPGRAAANEHVCRPRLDEVGRRQLAPVSGSLATARRLCGRKGRPYRHRELPDAVLGG